MKFVIVLLNLVFAKYLIFKHVAKLIKAGILYIQGYDLIHLHVYNSTNQLHFGYDYRKLKS